MSFNPATVIPTLVSYGFDQITHPVEFIIGITDYIEQDATFPPQRCFWIDVYNRLVVIDTDRLYFQRYTGAADVVMTGLINQKRIADGYYGIFSDYFGTINKVLTVVASPHDGHGCDAGLCKLRDD